MGTRGLLGVRNNKKFLKAKYNHWDSYYKALGEDVIFIYFSQEYTNEERAKKILELTKDRKEDDRDFIFDGLFCEYAYVYNIDNDTLEIYRGFFKEPQFEEEAKTNKRQLLKKLKNDNRDEYNCHLIMIIDRKKHTEKKVLEAFKKYEDLENKEDDDLEDEEEDDLCDYPERLVIPLDLPTKYKPIVR